MDDVEAAGAEPEVERGDVDDDLVALAHLPQQHLVGPGAAALAADLDLERLGRDDDAAAQLQAARSLPRPPRRRRDDPLADLEHLVEAARPGPSRRRCGRRRCRWRAGRSRSRRGGRRWRRCRRRSPPAAARGRRRAAPPRPAPAPASPSAPCSRGTALRSARRRRSRARSRPRRRRRRSARRPRPPARRRGCAPRRGSQQWPGTTLPEVPPWIRPTLAVVSSSSRPELHPRDRRRGGGDRAAAVLGPDPGVRLDPDEVGEDLLLGRRRDDHLADRAGVVEDEAGPRAQLRGVEGLRPAQPLLLGDGQDQLDPDRPAAFRRGGRPAP